MRRLCVFCGSSLGARERYAETARHLGELLAQHCIGLVYGGGHVGLMGALADAVLRGGGEVIGVIPQALVDKELAHAGLTELRVVATMHQRKAEMADLDDGFAALPGGCGTLDELDTSCCYARQDKVWVADPAGNRWEIYTVLADLDDDDHDHPGAACCTPVAGQPSACCT